MAIKGKIFVVLLAILLVGGIFLYTQTDKENIINLISPRIELDQEQAIQEWTIEGDKVFVDDESLYASASPHTLRGSDWVIFNFTSKVYTGDVDIVLGFDRNFLQPTQVERFNPTTELHNVSYTCKTDYFNHTVSPKKAWCFKNITTYIDNLTIDESHLELIWSGNFDTGNLESKTVYWEEEYIDAWKSTSLNFNSIDHDYQGMNKWYYTQDVPINEDQEYVFRVFIKNTNPWKAGTKYWFAIKPSSESISEAVSKGHLYALDPWTESLHTGLVAYFNLSSGEGSIFGRNVTDHKGTPNYQAGLIGDGLNLDGAEASVTTPPNSTYQLEGSDGFTWSFWFNADVWGDNDRLLSKRYSYDYEMNLEATGTTIKYEDGVGGGMETSTSYGTGSWIHVILLRNNTGIFFIINNVQEDTTANTIQNESAKNLGVTLGADVGGTLNFDGMMDEIGFWNRTLTRGEITALYNGGAGITYQPPIVPDDDPFVFLNIPINDTNQSLSLVTFNYTCEDDYMIDNSTFYINNVLNRTEVWETSNITSPEFTLSFPEGYYLWSVNCTDNASQINNSGIRSFNITFTPPTINLLTPINDTNTSSNVDDFLFNITFGGEDWTNYTFNVWDSSSTLIKNREIINGTPDVDCSETHLGVGIEVDCIGQGISTDDIYDWNVEGCKDNGLCDIATTNYTFTIDTTNPVISGLWNLTSLVVYDLPTSSNWSFNASDLHLESCWHNTSDNATIGMMTCNNTVITDWTTEGSKIVYYFANDSFGNEVSTSTLINITYISSTYSHTPDSVGELGSVFFDLFVNTSFSDSTTTTAYLWINNTLYDVDNADSYDNYTYFNFSFAVPDGWGNNTGWEYDYNWNYSIIDLSVGNTSTATDNFTVYSMEMDNCSAFDIEILRFNLNDEESNELVNASAGSNIEIDVTISLGSTEWTYHGDWDNNETARVCVPEGTINNTNYTIDYTVGFDSTDRVWEFFYLDNGILDNNNEMLDGQTNRTIDLYDLLSADSTSFLFNYFDEDGLPEENSIVHVFRKYIGEGLFREVERARQDENGDTTIHLVEEDVIYYFVISLEGTILYTSSTYTALCQAVPCTIQIEASGDLIEFDEDWDSMTNGSYSLTQSSLTRLVNLTYAFTESSNANLTLYRYNSEGDYVSIISEEETGTSGTISLLVPSSIGNKTFFATIYKDGDFIKSEWISMEEDAGIYFGNSLALFLAFLVILCLGLMGISEGGATIVWVIIGMILTSALGLIDFATSTGVSLLIYFICAGAIIMWKLTRGRK